MKTALVTGSSRGIGRAIAEQLRDNGYEVIFSGAHVARPDFLRAQDDYYPCDISSAEQRAGIFAHIAQAYGRLDVLVNNAGIAPNERADLLDMTEESFSRVLSVNLRGTMFMCQSAARMMLAQENCPMELSPRIINIGSISAYASSLNRGEYCVSKAGVGMITQLFAQRLAAEGIRVFEVRPGIIATDMTAGVHEKYERMIEDKLLPIPRFGQPEDVARMVAACCTGLLDYAAGQVLNADGGFSLRRL